MSSPRTVETRAADRSDEVVGAMRPPAWLRRVPPVAWIVLALGVLDVALRASANAESLTGGDNLQQFFVVLDLVAAAAPFVLLAAVVVGPTAGSARGWLLLGTGCLAVAELALLLIELADPFGADPPSTAADPWQPSAVMNLAGVLLRVLGPALLALGVFRAAADASRGDDTPFDGERSSLPGVVLVLGFIASLARLGVTLIGVLLLDPEADVLPGPLDLAAVIVACFGPLAWAAVAAAALTARRPPSTGWPWLVAGSAGLLVSSLAYAGATVVSAVAGWIGELEPTLREALLRLGGVGAVLGVVGKLALAAGLSVGPTRPAAVPAASDDVPGEAGEVV